MNQIIISLVALAIALGLMAAAPVARRIAGHAFSMFVPRIGLADLTTLSQLLKDVYDPVIEEQQNLEAFTWKEFDVGEGELGGKGWTFENKMGGNQEGIGSRAERGTLTEPGIQRYQTGLIYWKLLYGGYEVTGPVIEAARSNMYAFAVARTEEIAGLTRDLIKDFNRQVYGDGSGVLATCNGTVGANTFNVTNGQYLRLNMNIEIWNANTLYMGNNPQGNVVLAGPRKITALTPNADGTMTVTYDGADTVDPSNGFVVIRHQNATLVGGVRTGLEMEGLKKIADDGTVANVYLNINRTTFPLFKGHLFANGGVARNLSLDLLQQCEDQIYRASGQRPNWVRMNLGQRRKYFDLVAPDKRYMTGSIDGGYERLDYNGNTLTVDIDHPFGEITMLRKEVVRKFELRKFGMLDFDGLTMRMQGSTDVYRGYLGMYANLASKHPACTLRLIDLQEPPTTQWVS